MKSVAEVLSSASRIAMHIAFYIFLTDVVFSTYVITWYESLTGAIVVWLVSLLLKRIHATYSIKIGRRRRVET